ncbi:alpha-glucosidase [Turicibacter sp. TJ11]|uniref:glycoside hydrolase family 13 protein n=1 Tax=Turicibacter sp. TJ11 TaxID=2806443 RepID=UPI001F3FAA1F|nr:alpha-glucosidase [Turicibacter sp. TJ11]
MEKKWWHRSVVYQIYPRSFKDTSGNGIGDLRGVIEKLDYLKELGIDVIWLSPVYQSPMDDNGYDISNYQGIAPEFGTMADMDELIEQANQRGIRILMDLVVNHTSDEHPWFLEAKKSKNNPYRDYYIWRDASEDDGVPNELNSTFSGTAWQYDETTQQYYLHLFSKKQPDLNWGNQKLREEIYQMMNFWLEKGIGGFRMDVIDLIGKEIDQLITGNGPQLHPYLQEMNQASFGNYDVLTVGETWGATPEIAKLYSDPSRHELSMVFQFEHVSIDWHPQEGKWRPTTFDFIKFKEIMSKWQTSLKGEGWNSLFWNNHDLPRIVSRWGNDQQYRVQTAKMFASVLHLMQGTPYIFQGEEIGMTNVQFESLEEYNDIEIHQFYHDNLKKGYTHEQMMEAIWKNGRDNARTPMQWDESKNAGFTTGMPWLKVNPNYKTINVQNALKDKQSIFYHYKSLIELRKNSQYSETIIYGDYQLLLPEDQQVFAYIREDQQHRLLVVANFSEEQIVRTLEGEVKDVILSNYDETNLDLSNLELRPYEAIVFELNK